MKQNDRSKLPKWAQDELKQLEMRLKEREKELEQFRAPIEDSRVQYRLPAELDWRVLPEGVTVRFVDGDQVFDIHETRGDTGITVSAIRGTLHIQPKVTNVITLQSGE